MFLAAAPIPFQSRAMKSFNFTKRSYLTGFLLAAFAATLARAAAADKGTFAPRETKGDAPWNETLVAPAEPFTATGRNRFFILEPGYQLSFEGKEGGKAVRLTITVLEETKKVAGMETRVVEERETADGKLAEVSRNYFALGTRSRNVYYFGEDVDVYKGGKVVHEGAWLAGVKGARFGILMPGAIQLGARYYQEQAPGVAQDRAENVATNETARTPAGTFEHCLRVKETTPLEPDVSYKVYAPEVGLVEDGALRLVKHGFVKKAAKTGSPAAVASQGASARKPAWKDPLARQALSWVGADPQAEQYWVQAINDPSLPPNERQDLIEDLNEEGFPDPRNLTLDDLPLILSRIEIIEEHALDAMDEVNAAAFMEAYKDLVNMAGKLLP
jgi:hypothetical protein